MIARDQFAKHTQIMRRHAQFAQRVQPSALVEQTNHDPLVVTGRQRCDSQIDRTIAQLHGGSAILRQSFLGDVHLAEHLDARQHFFLNRLGNLEAIEQHAVDSLPHDHTVFVGLDVHVRRARLDGIEQQMIDQPDDRCATLGVQQVFTRRQRTNFAQHGIAVDRIDDLLGLAGAIRVGFVDRLLDCRIGCQQRLGIAPQRTTDDVQVVVAVAVTDRDQQAIVLSKADDSMRTRVSDPEPLQEIRIGLQLRKVFQHLTLQRIGQQCQLSQAGKLSVAAGATTASIAWGV